MNEFEFLKAMFWRVTEAKGFAAQAESKKNAVKAHAWNLAAVMLEQSVKDYLALTGTGTGRKDGNHGR